MGRCFEKKPLGLDLRPLKACYGWVMLGYDRDRGGPKDSENAHNSFLTKRTGRGFDDFVLILAQPK